ncbi:MAG: ATP-binding protein [Chitinivibrionales bacterium]|nr:ATP-binding protein [Chitinivibrionales bacterium]
MPKIIKTKQPLLVEMAALKRRLAEYEEALEAIRTGAVDALVGTYEHGERVFTRQGGDYGYRVMVENMNEGAVTLDKSGIVVFANKAFSFLAEREMSTIPGARFCDFLPGSLHEGFSAFFKECARRPCQAEFSLACTRGGATPVLLSGTMFEIGSRQNVCLLISDLRERKDAEATLRTAYTEVEKKVIERTLELQQKADELALANKELESFSFSVSHDLRNPLNAIMSNIGVLSQGNGIEPGTVAHQALTHIIQSAERMAAVISDLLTLSGISRRKIQVRKVDLSEITQNFISELRASNSHRKTEIHVPAGLTAQADAGLLRLLVENLVRNAWKFTSKKELTHIELGTANLNGRPCYFIRDNGVGFDMKDSDKLFKPYGRLHSASEYKGTGIGLSIAKRIMEKHGGAIWAQAETDKGATFYFCFA